MTIIKAIAAATTLLLGFAPARAAQTLAHRILVHGHRGTRGLRPENTLSAFEEAVRVGADAIELDMDVTKDDVVVVSHSQSISPEICLDAAGQHLKEAPPIRSLTVREVKAFDCGSQPNARFPEQKRVPGEKIPTLAEVFELVRRSTAPAAASVQFNIETKIVPGQPELSPDPDRFVDLVASLVEKYGMTRRVILESFDDRTLMAMRKRLPGVRLALLTSDNHLDFVAAAKSLGADIVSPDFLWITKDDVERLHSAGVQVLPWTPNEEAEWARLAELGVDGIITDYPEKLIAYLKSNKLRD